MIQEGNGSDGGNTETNIIYLPPKASQYGAVAFDKKSNLLGSSHSLSSKSLAKSAALADCASTGAHNCKVISTYANTCVGIAWGKNTGGSGTIFVYGDLNSEIANKITMQKCSLESTNCTLLATECSLP